MSTSTVKWSDLASLAEKMVPSGPGSVAVPEWRLLDSSLMQLESVQDWVGIVRLREMFDFLVKGETTGGLPVVQRVNDAAIVAAGRLRDYKSEARYLHDRGENYHRQGYHQKSIEAFRRSSRLYEDEGESLKSLHSYYFMALPCRALGRVDFTREILENVLRKIPDSDPWRANPLQVLSWLERDSGRFSHAEELLREALKLYRTTDGNTSAHVVQTLADLGEIVGLRGRLTEGSELFGESTEIAEKLGGQYNRQGARTRLKHAEMLIRDARYDQALSLLDDADDLIRGYGHYYDLLWRIELARSFAFAGRRQWGNALLKMRAVIRYRRELSLQNSDLIRQLVMRWRRGTGLPK